MRGRTVVFSDTVWLWRWLTTVVAKSLKTPSSKHQIFVKDFLYPYQGVSSKCCVPKGSQQHTDIVNWMHWTILTVVLFCVRVLKLFATTVYAVYHFQKWYCGRTTAAKLLFGVAYCCTSMSHLYYEHHARLSVRLSVCNVGALRSHSATKSGNRHMTGQIGVLATCMPKPTSIVISRDPEFYRDQWDVSKNMEFYTSAGIINGSHVTLLAPAELLVRRVLISTTI